MSSSAPPSGSKKPSGQRRRADGYELSIATTLMAGAFGLIGLAIFASASVFDKVTASALQAGFWFGLAAVVVLVVSILFGGWGMSRNLTPGFLNAFNLQALCGLLGIVLLCIAGAIFTLHPKPDEKDKAIAELERQLDHAERRTSELAERIAVVERHSAAVPPPIVLECPRYRSKPNPARKHQSNSAQSCVKPPTPG